MHKKTLFLTMLFVLTLFLMGCGTTAQNQEPRVEMNKEVNGLKISMVTNKIPGANPVIVKVMDSQGKPVKNLTIEGELSMPSMVMQGYPQKIDFSGDGDQYTSLLQIPHGGQWRVELSIHQGNEPAVKVPLDFTINQ